MCVKRSLIRGQKVKSEKVARSRELRRAATDAEQALWERLRARRLDGWKFRRQQVIAGFIVDFYCDLARLVVEVDGPIHQGQPEYDARRDEVLCSHSLRVLRVTNAAVEHDIEAVLHKIREYLTAADLTSATSPRRYTAPPSPLRRGGWGERLGQGLGGEVSE
ncbi:MAG: hypothetical protein OHK0015_03880 [Chloroflexi bacterium OHK40]